MLEFYVVRYDVNKDKVVMYNIFNSLYFKIGLKKIINLKENDFYLELDSLCKYCFWSKVEHEILVSDVFNKIEKKIDIYFQLKQNLKVLAQYILSNKIEVDKY